MQRMLLLDGRRRVISKELFSEVLGDTIKKHDRTFVEVVDSVKSGKDMHINYKRKDGIIALYIINIYELMHLMKLHFEHYKINLMSGYAYGFGGYCYDDNMSNDKYYRKLPRVESKFASTEPEAIFKACQWILDNKEML